MNITLKLFSAVLAILLFSGCTQITKNRSVNQVTGHIGKSGAEETEPESAKTVPTGTPPALNDKNADKSKGQIKPSDGKPSLKQDKNKNPG